MIICHFSSRGKNRREPVRAGLCWLEQHTAGLCKLQLHQSQSDLEQLSLDYVVEPTQATKHTHTCARTHTQTRARAHTHVTAVTSLWIGTQHTLSHLSLIQVNTQPTSYFNMIRAAPPPCYYFIHTADIKREGQHRLALSITARFRLVRLNRLE